MRRLDGMTAKEKLRAQIDEQSEVAAARIVIERVPSRTEAEPEMVGLPESWHLRGRHARAHRVAGLGKFAPGY